MDTQTLAIALGALIAGFLLGRLTAGGDSKTVTTIVQPARAADAGVDAAVEAHLRADRKLEAIKAYRDAYGGGLKEAKDAVESIEARLGGR